MKQRLDLFADNNTAIVAPITAVDAMVAHGVTNGIIVIHALSFQDWQHWASLRGAVSEHYRFRAQTLAQLQVVHCGFTAPKWYVPVRAAMKKSDHTGTG